MNMITAIARPTFKKINLISLFFQWAALARSRQELASLDADRLEDVGVSAIAAQKEAARAPWDVPQTWIN